MDVSLTASRITEADVHASAAAFPTKLIVWSGGIAVEMWDRNRRMERRVTWEDIETNFTNPIMAAIDACVIDLFKRDA